MAITGGSGTAFSYLATDALGSATLAADATGNVQATQLYAPYGGVRYSSGSMPTDYGFTGQHSDTTTGLDYYGARYYDPLAGQFTSADTALPGDDPWSLSRYAYVAGNPLIRLDPTGHCWVVCAIVHAVTHAVKAAVKVVAVVADTTLGISSMISDVKIIFSGKTNFFQKVLAVGDLSLNAFMDVTTVIGVGEGLRAGYLGVKVAGKVGLRALGKIATHEGEDAVAHVAEHEVADVAERGAEREAEHAAESCALSFAPSTQVSTPRGLQAIASLKVGDVVTAYDPATGKASVQTVQQTYINHDTNLLAVTLRTVPAVPAKSTAAGSDKQQDAALAAHGAHAPPTVTTTTHDETIQTTTNHPWLSADHGWILASFLHVGEPVQRVDGSTAIVVSVQAEPGVAAMWDLTISNVHTFAVGGGAYAVHNCGQVDYGSTDLSQAVKDQRIAMKENAHNFGAARLDDDSIITGMSRGRGYHAEQDLLDQADSQGKRIVELYTEREPCGGCNRLLQGRGITNVTWTWAYRDVDVGGRAAIGAAIRSIYRGLW